MLLGAHSVDRLLSVNSPVWAGVDSADLGDL